MSIPKRISYCWFGGNPLPEKVKKCIDSWKKLCPDYEIIQWDESNYDVNKIPFVRDAYKEKKWAFVSDYARLDVIYEHGGIYLDTDVEIIKNIDFMLETESFFAIETDSFCIATGLGFGAEPKNAYLKDLMEIYEAMSFYKEDGSLNLKACPIITTDYFEQIGFKKEDSLQKIDKCVIYPSEYLCPMDYYGNMYKTDNTVGIHWFDASWRESEDRHLHDMQKKLNQKLPQGISKIAFMVYRIGYCIIEYSKKGILLKKITDKIKKK